jgi:hypothetical protein
MQESTPAAAVLSRLVGPTYSRAAPTANPLLPCRCRLVAVVKPRPCTIATNHTTGRAPSRARPEQEAVMGKAIPTQHPAVVLRSHFNALRALVAAALIAVVGLSAAVVILATDDERDTSAVPATQASAPGPPGSTRYDGGPEEGTRGAVAARQPGVRYDGGPEEGTAALTQRSARATFDPNSIKSPPGVRYDGGPEEGSHGALSSDAPSNTIPGTRYDGGPEEGSRGSGR